MGTAVTDTVNFTIALDRDALRRAKIIAARHDTSVNAMIRHYLDHLHDFGLDREDNASGNSEVMFRYSMGLIPKKQAMKELGVSDYGIFVRMMGRAGLPLPAVSKDLEQKMVDDFLQVVNQRAGK